MTIVILLNALVCYMGSLVIVCSMTSLKTELGGQGFWVGEAA